MVALLIEQNRLIERNRNMKASRTEISERQFQNENAEEGLENNVPVEGVDADEEKENTPNPSEDDENFDDEEVLDEDDNNDDDDTDDERDMAAA